jgi:hypothetical protein
MNFEAIYKEALEEANKAATEYVKNNGEGFPCGFAWVHLENGRSAFSQWSKKHGVASKHWHKGFYIWNPSKYATQSVDVLFVGALAFSNVLKKYGIECAAQSRLD